MSGQRADARRNYTRILEVAVDEVAAHGVEASLEQIARVAGVGSATVRRHFPTRRALLDAVFHERIEVLCTSAHDLADAPDPRGALLEWLAAVMDYGTTASGFADALVLEGAAHEAAACATKLADAGTPLVQRAQHAGVVIPEVTVIDLITLITGIALATEHHPDPAAEADRLLNLAMAGISPVP
jgi:AcrR family transcriptional regulator